MLESVKDFLFPRLCFCGEATIGNEVLCSNCWSQMDFSTSNICFKCGVSHEHDFGGESLCPACIQSDPEFDFARFVFKYSDFSGRFISMFKYADKTHIAEILSKFLINKIKEQPDFDDFDIITSVPISRSRLLKRKFNQSAILANKIGQNLNMKTDNLLLHRVKNVPPQTGLRRKDRLKNVKGAFAVSPKMNNKLENARVILIDDVYTTGATLNECSKTLKEKGAGEVFALTVARTFLN